MADASPQDHPPDSGPVTGAVAVDATRRTYLANERTFLAWFRTALACLAIAITIGRVLPEITGGDAVPFQVIGIGFGLIGLFAAVYGALRERQVDRVLAQGGYVPVSARAVVVMVGALVVLGVGLLGLVVVL